MVGAGVARGLMPPAASFWDGRGGRAYDSAPRMKLPRSSRLRERAFRNRSTGTESTGARKGGNGQLDKLSKPPRPDKAQRRKLLREYVAWLWPHWPRILFILILSLIVMALDMVWPL